MARAELGEAVSASLQRAKVSYFLPISGPHTNICSRRGCGVWEMRQRCSEVMKAGEGGGHLRARIRRACRVSEAQEAWRLSEQWVWGLRRRRNSGKGPAQPGNRPQSPEPARRRRPLLPSPLSPPPQLRRRREPSPLLLCSSLAAVRSVETTGRSVSSAPAPRAPGPLPGVPGISRSPPSSRIPSTVSSR